MAGHRTSCPSGPTLSPRRPANRRRRCTNPNPVTSAQESRMRPSALCLPLCLALALPASGCRRHPRGAGAVQAPAHSGATVKGHLSGREDIDYILGAKAGQHMTVELHTDNPQNYFNILPPGSQDEALFVGSSSGSRFEGTLPDSGDYRVRVYLMRAAARRDEQANYSLSIHIGNGQPGQGSAAPGRRLRRRAGRRTGLLGGAWGPPGRHPQPTRRPLAHERVVGEIGNGSVMRNLGCRMSGGQRWCQVARAGGLQPPAAGWLGATCASRPYQP